MDPITIGLMAAGLGMQLFGGMKQADNAKQQAAVSQDIAGQEQSINTQKQQQMHLQANRMQLENFRNVQRARAQGLNAAVQQGAQFGSGIAGGQAEATDQGMMNSLGINQNLQIGDNIAGYNQKISSDKMQLSSLGGEAATDAGISSFGSSLFGAAGTIGKMGKGVGSMNFNSLFGGGSPSGYGA